MSARKFLVTHTVDEIREVECEWVRFGNTHIIFGNGHELEYGTLVLALNADMVSEVRELLIPEED